MAPRQIRGNLPGGGFGWRFARPGYNVLTEPLGSPGISFDTRLTDFGIVHQIGIWNWGSPPVSFPALPYIPLVTIQQVLPGNVISTTQHRLVQIRFAQHFTSDFVAIVTNSTLTIQQFTNPYYGFTPQFTRWLYTVFAIDAA